LLIVPSDRRNCLRHNSVLSPAPIKLHGILVKCQYYGARTFSSSIFHLCAELPQYRPLLPATCQTRVLLGSCIVNEEENNRRRMRPLSKSSTSWAHLNKQTSPANSTYEKGSLSFGVARNMVSGVINAAVRRTGVFSTPIST
jgi:hypothetical protein